MRGGKREGAGRPTKEISTKYKKISISIPPEMYDWITSAANRNEITESELIRKIIEAQDIY